MKALLVLMWFPLTAWAKVYHCENNGKTIYSDVPCGENATTVEISQPEKTGTQLSNDSMKAVSETLQRDREQRELDRAIQDQRIKIDDMQEKYQARLQILRRKLDALEDKEIRARYSEYPKITLEQRQTRRDLKQKIRELKEDHKYKMERARDKLERLKAKRKQLK
jgi:hypothetical protein